jgi:hypothetical protein
MFIDVVNAGWVPIYNLNLSEDVTERAAAPIIAKYTGVLAAADIEVFTTTTTFQIMQSWRLDRGHSGPVHP